MNPRVKKGSTIALVLLSILLAIFLAQKINLTTADIGRHVKNGDVFLNASTYNISRSALLHTNFFSYTKPDFPFVNHHWGSGILFYLIFSLIGWSGLSLFFILCFLLAFILMFTLARQKLSLYWLIPLSIFLIPLIGDRAEIRPEVLSYLFITVFIFLLTKYSEGLLRRKLLRILPIIILFWANLHIYFIFGLFVIGAFILEMMAHKNWGRVKFLLTILLFSIISSCITPFGPKALLYPFTIFQNYGYKLVENQSIGFLENIGFFSPSFIWWKIIAGLGILLTLCVVIPLRKDNKKIRNFPIALGIITLTFGILSYTAIRNFTFFGLVLLPYLAYCLNSIGIYSEKVSRSDTALSASVVITLVLLIIIPIRFSTNMPWSSSWGIGLMPNVNASAEFVQTNHIDGPIFSNYDIGGYLIYHLFPTERVFVDNRPEAYSVSFFQDTYVPMQENLEIWREKSEEYNFNTIWFYRHDLTPWAQKFLLRMVDDSLWAPVYVDNYTIIFLKRNEKNFSFINKFELPRSLFSSSKI
ncbi:MAG: hypothetical protein ABIF06_01260 [bacterium]